MERLSLRALIDAIGVIRMSLYDDRPIMNFVVTMQSMESSYNARKRLGISGAFRFNKDLSTRQRKVTEWEPVCLGQFFFSQILLIEMLAQIDPQSGGLADCLVRPAPIDLPGMTEFSR